MKKLKSLIVFVLMLLTVVPAFAAPKQVIILQVIRSETSLTVSYILWTVPAVPIPLKATTVSIWTGASAAENAAIAAGTTVEIAGDIIAPPGATKAQIQTRLAAIFAATQNAQTVNPQGCFFDGTVWSC